MNKKQNKTLQQENLKTVLHNALSQNVKYSLRFESVPYVFESVPSVFESVPYVFESVPSVSAAFRHFSPLSF